MLKFSNFGKATVASAPVGVSGLSFTLQAGTGLNFPVLGAGDYCYGIFKDASGNHEIVKIESRNTDSLQIAVGGRGLDGTSARTWAAGDYFVAGLVNLSLQELFNANLTGFGAIAGAADTIPYLTAPNTFAVTGFSAFARELLNDVDAAAMRATIGAAMIPAGSITDWFQPTAPVGWTQITTHDNKALRVVSGLGAGSGGTVSFSAAFASKAVTGTNAAVALTKAQIPAHVHNYTPYQIGGGLGNGGSAPGSGPGAVTNTGDGSADGLAGQAHNHTFTGTPINLAVQYIDMILASRN